MNKIAIGLIGASALILAGCGSTPGERGLSGAAVGAAGGAVIGAMAGNPGMGAAAGAVAGGVVGAATSPCDVNLDGGRGCRDQRNGR